jgi:TRAP-type C4-dicarboxylate transport system substrate-binding protein
MRRAFFALCLVLIAAVVGGLTASCSSNQAGVSSTTKPAETVILKFASAATADYIPDEQAFCDAVNARIGPAYKIEYYPAGQMLSFPELLDGIRTGAAEMGAITPSFNSGDEPKLGAVELPFLLNNNDAHRSAVPGLKPLYGDILEGQFNQKLLNLHNYMGMALISKKPVKKLEDFQGLLIQAISPVFADMIQELGAAPVSGQPYTEAYQLIEKGTIDGTIQAPSSMVSYALYDVAKYMASAYLVSAVHGFSINLNAWNKLPTDVQDAIVEEAEIYSDKIDQFVADKYAQDHIDLANNGVEIFYPDKTELNRWREAVKPLYEKAKNTYPDFYEKIMAVAADANEKYPAK